jgi:tRNA uridine 5-carboxymethylaminomethyl modification enzyme
MFSSRAEYRLILREDNADLRLTPYAQKLGLIDSMRHQVFEHKKDVLEKMGAFLSKTFIQFESNEAKQLCEQTGQLLNREASLESLLRRPEVDIQALMNLPSIAQKAQAYREQLNIQSQDLEETVWDQVLNQLEVQIKYEGYIQKQTLEIANLKSQERILIPEDFDYGAISGLSKEVLEKLKKHKPTTLGVAGRIPGITPAAISLLLIFLKRAGHACII